MPTLIGHDTQTGQEVSIGDIEHRSGLYILGKPGMGKSTLLVNLMHDVRGGMFCIDPHGDTIREYIENSFSAAYRSMTESIRIFDPTDETHSFGINPLSCRDLNSLRERNDTYTRSFHIFQKLFENERGDLGLWLQLIIQHTLPVFIENPSYTLAEMPLFLTNTAFREHMLGNVRYDRDPLFDFWHDRHNGFQPEQAQPAITRLRMLLGNRYVRDIVGQTKTTIDFAEEIHSLDYLTLVRLPPNLPPDAKKFIGTIIISELLHAAFNRDPYLREHITYHIFVDEFHNFATDDFATMITEGRKFGIATTIAHQERAGQLGKNEKVLNATMACANKVIFQVTVKDAQELAPEFAEEPTTDTRPQQNIVVSPHPFWNLVERGHGNPEIQNFVMEHFVPIVRSTEEMKARVEAFRSGRQVFQDKATQYRDMAGLASLADREAALDRRERLDDRRYAIGAAIAASQNMMAAHEKGESVTKDVSILSALIMSNTEKIQLLDEHLYLLLSGKISLDRRDERLVKLIARLSKGTDDNLYINLRFGDLNAPVIIPSFIACKYYPEEQEEAYLRPTRERVEAKAMGLPLNERRAFVEKELRYSRIVYRQAKLVYYTWSSDVGIQFLPTQQHWLCAPCKKTGPYPTRLPDLPSRVLTATEREYLLSLCVKEMGNEFVNQVDKAVEFCRLLTNHENMLHMASNQYIEQPVHRRQVSDMVNETMQVLANLDPFSAFAKVIQISEGYQNVLKTEIKTVGKLERPDGDLGALEKGFENIEERILAYTRRNRCMAREEIDREIRQRQAPWRSPDPGRPLPSQPRGGLPPGTFGSEPPPTSEELPRP